MATLFEMVDKVKPKTKKIVIGIVLFGIFLATVDEKSASRYTPPVTTTKISLAPLTNSSANTPPLNSVSPLSTNNSPSLPSNTPPLSNATTTTTEIVPPPAPLKIKPSFNCQKAQSDLEKIICSDAELASLDKQVAHSYSDALLKTPKDMSEEVRNAQRDFLKLRTIACQIPRALQNRQNLIKYTMCLKKLYSQRLVSITQPSDGSNRNAISDDNSRAGDTELPWLKEKNNALQDNLESQGEQKPALGAVLSQQDFDACLNGVTSRCHFELNSQQQAVLEQSRKNLTACLNGWSYACNKALLTPKQTERVQESDLKRNFTACINGWSYACDPSLLTNGQQVAVNKSDLQRNYTACINGWDYACNRSLLTTDQQMAVNKSALRRNYTACINGWSYACNKQFLTSAERREADRRDLERNYNACLHGWDYACNPQLLTPEQLQTIARH